MIVPAFWAEARRVRREDNRQMTVRRFGWSDVSQADAQAMADQRADLALVQRWVAGPKIAQSEPKVPYNGAEGLPIREEIVARHGETVLTRNSYGAICLNTPNVLFVDIDHPKGSEGIGPVVFGLLLCWVVVWLRTNLPALGAGAGFLGSVLALLSIMEWLRPARLRSGRAEKAALQRIQRFQAARAAAGWRLRVYRTPLGLRVLALHRTFEPEDPEIREAFDALGTDRAYRYMCERQRCFRARLTGKPWRMGITTHLRPRPGVWPVAPERMPARTAWLSEYDQRAAGFAACHFLEELGDGPVHPAAVAVRELHDLVCRAQSGLPLA